MEVQETKVVQKKVVQEQGVLQELEQKGVQEQGGVQEQEGVRVELLERELWHQFRHSKRPLLYSTIYSFPTEKSEIES